MTTVTKGIILQSDLGAPTVIKIVPKKITQTIKQAPHILELILIMVRLLYVSLNNNLINPQKMRNSCFLPVLKSLWNSCRVSQKRQYIIHVFLNICGQIPFKISPARHSPTALGRRRVLSRVNFFSLFVPPLPQYLCSIATTEAMGSEASLGR